MSIVTLAVLAVIFVINWPMGIIATLIVLAYTFADHLAMIAGYVAALGGILYVIDRIKRM